MELINIWQKPEEYPKVIEFWKELNALPLKTKPEDRAKELAYMAMIDGKVVGVTTAARARVTQLNDNYFFFYRMLIHPDWRRPGLSSKLIVLTRDLLEQQFLQQKTDCIGLLVVTDKPEFVTRRNEAVWRASKLTYIGNMADGRHMRVYYFKGARI